MDTSHHVPHPPDVRCARGRDHSFFRLVPPASANEGDAAARGAVSLQLAQACGTLGPYATIRRANEIAYEAGGLGYSTQVFHNGDGYYVRACKRESVLIGCGSNRYDHTRISSKSGELAQRIPVTLELAKSLCWTSCLQGRHPMADKLKAKDKVDHPEINSTSRRKSFKTKHCPGMSKRKRSTRGSRTSAT